MPSIVSFNEYLIYWIGGGIALIIGLTVGVIQMIRNRGTDR